MNSKEDSQKQCLYQAQKYFASFSFNEAIPTHNISIVNPLKRKTRFSAKEGSGGTPFGIPRPNVLIVSSHVKRRTSGLSGNASDRKQKTR